MGMRAWRLKVEDLEGSKITFKQSAKRYFTGTILFGITLLYIVISSRSEALHDVISKTKIIRHYN